MIISFSFLNIFEIFKTNGTKSSPLFLDTMLNLEEVSGCQLIFLDYGKKLVLIMRVGIRLTTRVGIRSATGFRTLLHHSCSWL